MVPSPTPFLALFVTLPLATIAIAGWLRRHAPTLRWPHRVSALVVALAALGSVLVVFSPHVIAWTIARVAPAERGQALAQVISWLQWALWVVVIGLIAGFLAVLAQLVRLRWRRPDLR